MKIKTIAQTFLILVILGIVFYIVYPKYTFFTKERQPSGIMLYYRCNTVTGEIEWKEFGNKWNKI